jgi:hypothetical protein
MNVSRLERKIDLLFRIAGWNTDFGELIGPVIDNPDMSIDVIDVIDETGAIWTIPTSELYLGNYIAWRKV